MSIAGVVLTGGQSKRMGSDKSLLKIGSKNLIQYSTQLLLDSGIKNTFISGKQGIKDTHTNKGPLAGILTCMQQLKSHDYIIFTPIDMPLLNKFVFLKLISQKNQSAVYFENQYLPLLIKNNLINQKIIIQQLKNNKLSINNLLQQLGAKYLENHFPTDVFINTNTEKEWLKAKSLLDD